MRSLKMLATAVLMGAFALSATAPARAYDCDSVVVDEAGWFEGDTGKVEAAANDLITHGATVRVRTVADYGSVGSLDNYKAQVQQSCPSWRSADGGMRNNLIVFMASEAPEHEVGIYFGDQWKPAFKNNATTNIQDEAMVPHFRDGDPVSGFVTGMQQADQLVDLQLHPPKTNGPVVINNQKPVDYSGVWMSVLGIILFLIVAVVAIVTVARRRTYAESQRTAQLTAKNAQTACGNAINAFNPVVLAAKVKAAADISSAEEASALNEALEQAKLAFSNAGAEFSRLGNISGNNPAKDGLTPSEYNQMAKVYGVLQQKLVDAEAFRSGLEQKADGVRKDAEQAPQKVDAATQAIAGAKTQMADIEKNGYRVGGAQSLIEEAQKLLDQATAAQAQKKPGAAVQFANQASGKAKEAAKAANELPTIKAGIDKAVTALGTRAKGIDSLGKNAKETFHKMADEFVEKSFANVAGNGTEAEKRFAAAQEAVRDATASASMEQQDWENAQKLLKQATTSYNEAEALLQAILTLHDNLVQAKKKASAEIDLAQADIDKAVAYIGKHGADIDDALEESLKTASNLLDQARAELKLKKPDYIVVVKTALAANQAADDIFAKASNEHETAERQRRQAESLMEEAKRSIDAAQSYINIHSSDVESGAKGLLQEASDYYVKARKAKTLDSQITAAKSADEKADSALASAKSDVAEEEDRIRRRRQQSSNNDLAIGIAIGAASSSRRSSTWGSPPSSSHSSGSGSSSGFGHSSFGGGSSSSFGHSSSGGGHASKW